jgi:hypothetical protein
MIKVYTEEARRLLAKGGYVMYLDSDGDVVGSAETLVRAGYAAKLARAGHAEKPPQLSEVLKRAQELLSDFGVRLDRLEQSRQERRARRTAAAATAGEPTNAAAETVGGDLPKDARDEASSTQTGALAAGEDSSAQPLGEVKTEGADVVEEAPSTPPDEQTPQPGAEAPEPTRGKNHV